MKWIFVALLSLLLTGCSAAYSAPERGVATAPSSEIVYDAGACVSSCSAGCHAETITVGGETYECWVIPVDGWTVFAPATPLPWVPKDAVTYPLYYLPGHEFWVGYRDLDRMLWVWDGPFENPVTVPRPDENGYAPDLADDHVVVRNSNPAQELPIWKIIYND